MHFHSYWSPFSLVLNGTYLNTAYVLCLQSIMLRGKASEEKPQNCVAVGFWAFGLLGLGFRVQGLEGPGFTIVPPWTEASKIIGHGRSTSEIIYNS